MNTRTKAVRAAVVLAAAGALLLTGCGEQEADPQAVSHSGPVTPSPTPAQPKPAAPVADSAAESVAGQTPARAPKVTPEPIDEVPVENVPTELPPGDPGVDAPPAPDPGVPDHDREHEEPAQRTVPAEAMLDAQTVSAVLGGDWQPADAATMESLSTDAVAERSAAFSTGGVDGSGGLLQYVATHRSLAAADRAVGALAGQLANRGWTQLRNPRLGTASTALRSGDGSRTAVVISAEGVTVALVGSGAATAHRGGWTSLQDLALGSSCAAAPHGCH
ncbi:MAG TPA: hypothetical protein VHG70_17820 [Nocardioidaceae bacterium]|nr:hypothetical protein [Nocardioidaceae bacterium]